MIRVNFIMGLLMILQVTCRAQELYVPVEKHSPNGYVGMRVLEIAKGNGNYWICIGENKESVEKEEGIYFNKQTKGTLSSSYPKMGGLRLWITSESGNQYRMLIFDPAAGGKYRLFFKTCPLDKSSMSESKFMYVVSKADWDKIDEFLIKPFILYNNDINVAEQGDIFGDGVHFNKQAIGK